GMLRLQDGQAGRIETGNAFPVATRVSPWQTQVGVVNASSGFEARPQLLGDGRVRVQIHPFEGSVERSGAIRTGGADTEVTVKPGETIALGSLEQDRQPSTRGLAGGAEESSHAELLLLLRAEVEGAPAPAR